MNEICNDIRERKKYYLIYSGIFLFCITSYILYLVLNGKTNINATDDGMNQHFKALIYLSRYLKKFFHNLFINHKFILPLWDFSIGEGSDIISAFHGYGLADPIVFLSVFVPEKYMFVFYMFNAAIRIYLSGLFFSEFCFYKGLTDKMAILAGTIVYCFSFWTIKNFTLHIYFLTPYMYLPLLLLGVEKIINGDKPYVFIFAVLFSSISYLYFFYVEAIATAIYGIVRVVFKYKMNIKAVVLELLKILSYALLGIMIGAIILCPVVYTYLGDNRMSIEHPVSLLYSRFFYERLYAVFVGNDYPYDISMGYAAPTLLSIALVFKKPKKNILLLIFGIICFICVLFPICGMALNGFAYVSQRWTFVLALPVAYSLIVTWEELKGNDKYLFVSIIGIILLSMFSAWSRNERGFVPVIFIILFYIVSHLKTDKKILSFSIKDIIMIILLIMNIFYVGQYHLSTRGKNIFRDLLSIEDARNLTLTSEAYVMKEYTKDENEFFRYSGSNLTNNASILFDVYSTNYYWSISNVNDNVFRMKMDLRDRFSNQIKGYDDRAELETLANIKYYITSKSYDGTIPYGFDNSETYMDRIVYTNNYYIPFGYTYKNAISYDKWDRFDSLQKQEALMQAVVIDGTDNNANVDYNQIKNIEYSIVCEEGIEQNGNSFIVKNNNSKVSINFNSEKNLENYFCIKGLSFIDTESLVEEDNVSSMIHLTTSNGYSTYLQYLPYGHRYSFGKTDYVFYFGNGEDDYNNIDITFQLEGIYTFDSILVRQKSMDNYENYVSQLKEYHLENVAFDCNRVSGRLDCNEDRYLLLSIPYSKGWKAFIDGYNADTLKANDHYVTVKVESGSHEIVLEYITPGLKIGTFISLVGCVCLMMLIYMKEKNKTI